MALSTKTAIFAQLWKVWQNILKLRKKKLNKAIDYKHGQNSYQSVRSVEEKFSLKKKKGGEKNQQVESDVTTGSVPGTKDIKKSQVLFNLSSPSPLCSVYSFV